MRATGDRPGQPRLACKLGIRVNWIIWFRGISSRHQRETDGDRIITKLIAGPELRQRSKARVDARLRPTRRRRFDEVRRRAFQPVSEAWINFVLQQPRREVRRNDFTLWITGCALRRAIPTAFVYMPTHRYATDRELLLACHWLLNCEAFANPNAAGDAATAAGNGLLLRGIPWLV